MDIFRTSRFLSFILRHHPEVIGITPDEHGWVNVDDLIEKVNQQHFLDMPFLEEIVRTDRKQRYSFNEDKTMIRANYGHSIPVDVAPEELAPPKVLFHGSAEKYTESIAKQGLLPKGRQYVHLSVDMETAISVGRRHGKPVVYRLDTKQMYDDGIPFYRSSNGIWLVREVPAKYLVERMEL